MKVNRLIGFSCLVESPKNVWLLIHGNRGQVADREYVIHCLSIEDSVFILEYPGYGNRSGKPSRKSFNEAAEEAYWELRERFPGTPVCVAGESIGSGGACYLAWLNSPLEKSGACSAFRGFVVRGEREIPIRDCESRFEVELE